MPKKITLSYSTINNCLQEVNSHNWLNKQLGLKPEERPEWKEGTEGHRIIQHYLVGKPTKPYVYTLFDGTKYECVPYMENIKYRFPVVEEEDFDPRCKIVIPINDEVEVIGFVDAIDEENKRFGEIKLSSNVWSPKKYMDSFQKKIYALAFKDFTEAVLITGGRNPEMWEHQNLKVYPMPLTNKDRNDAMEYILKAVEVIKSGDFTGGLDEDGICRNKFCYYGANCSFKENYGR